MTTREDLFFRQVVTLRDGARVLLRPLMPEDRQALHDLFTHVPEDDAVVMRHDVRDPSVIDSWIENIHYEGVFPLVAMVGEQMVGEATLHFLSGPYRHRGELRIFLSKEFRRRGLGTKMVHAIIEFARRRNLLFLEVQVLANLVNDVKAMQKAGFETRCVFEDYFIMPDGELRDVVHLILRLRSEQDEF